MVEKLVRPKKLVGWSGLPFVIGSPRLLIYILSITLPVVLCVVFILQFDMRLASQKKCYITYINANKNSNIEKHCVYFTI